MTESTCTMSKSLHYEELRKQQLEDATSTLIYGVPIELGEFIRAIQPQNLFAIWGCYCVQDSPDNPCPCGRIVWLPADRVLRSGKTQRKSPEGHELHWFRVKNDADIVVEEQVAVGVREYARQLRTDEFYISQCETTQTRD